MSEERNSIREEASAWLRFEWASALFVLSQLGRAFGGNNSEKAGSVEAVNRAVESQFSEGMRMVLQAGELLQQDFTNAMFGAFLGEADIPRLATKTAIDLAYCAAGTAGALLPDRADRVHWIELQNKLETFNLFAHVDLAINVPRTKPSLTELVDRVSRLGRYRSVWATEGVGHFYDELCSRSGDHINLKFEANHLPSSSLAALHAGAGLSFADRSLRGIKDSEGDSELRSQIAEFVACCNKYSDENYVGAAYEALGLTVRNLHPHLLANVDRQLAAIDHELVAYFWHGVGRGIYFAPTNFLPVGAPSRRMLQQVLQEPPHQLGRLNAQSGLIWALLLVNVRHPEVLEAFIEENAGELSQEVFTNAVCSAVVIWRESSPDDGSLNALCRHRPTDQRTAAIWDAWVSQPCTETLHRYYGVLTSAGLGRLFRHQSLAKIFRSSEALESGNAGLTNAAADDAVWRVR